MSNTISQLQARAYRQSADKGFHDDEPALVAHLLATGHPKWAAMVQSRIDGNRIALMHSELSEALEELRKGKRPNETYYPTIRSDESMLPTVQHKPKGVPSELADVVIRVLDFCGANEIDLESMIIEKLDYNATRGHKHGKKF